VFALPGGSVPEIVQSDTSGAISSTAEEMAYAVTNTTYAPEVVRAWVEQRFSVKIMVQRYIELYEGILNNNFDSDLRFDLGKVVAA
jgi:hypothetical protein